MVASSSAKSEFRVMAHRVRKVLWLKILLKELRYDSADPKDCIAIIMMQLTLHII